MRTLFVITVILAALVAAKCANGKDSVKVGGMCECEWYKAAGGTCCPTAVAVGSLSSVGKDAETYGATCSTTGKSGNAFPCAGVTRGCSELVNLAGCGTICSPDQSKFTSDLGVKTLCKDFSKRIYEACKDQKYFDTTADEWECKPLSDVFKNETVFVGSILGAVVGDDNKDCLNSGSLATISGAVVGLFTLGALSGARNPLFITAAILVLSSIAVSAECISGDPEKVENACGCEWYKKSTCCPTQYGMVNAWAVNTVCMRKDSYKLQFTCEPPLTDACQDALDFADCASDCSPDQKKITTLGVLQVCEDQATKVYDACKNDQAFDSNTDQFKCRRVADIFDKKEKLMNHLGYAVANSTDDCWNSAPASVLSVAAVALFSVLFF